MTQVLIKEKLSFVPAMIMTIVMVITTMFMVGGVGAEGLTLGGGKTVEAPTSEANNDVNTIIATAVKMAKTISGLVVAVAVIVIVFAGFKYATSQGDPKAMEGAKQQIIAAGIGMAIAFMAILIVSILGSVFGIGGETATTSSDTATKTK